MTTERRQETITALERLEDKVDIMSAQLTADHEDHHEYLKIVIEREARRTQLHRAIIEKTLTSLIWSLIVGAGYLMYQGLLDQWKH